MLNLLIFFIQSLFILSYFIHETNIYCIPSIFQPLCQMLVISGEQENVDLALPSNVKKQTKPRIVN